MHAVSALHGQNDFDFLIGNWQSRQRMLRSRLQGDTEWETFTACSRVHRLPGGVANFDTLVAEAWRPGWVGMSMRVFNPVTGLWSIYWLTNDGSAIDASTGHLAPPVVGRFVGDTGTFEGDDVHEGRPIRVRYVWHRQGPDRARWEQAFSDDGARTWEVNWIMEFERAPDGPGAPVALPVAAIEAEVVELRRYTLHTGQRDTLIDLFDREFVESQEDLGMSVMGQFREETEPDRFVWLRGFPDMVHRARSLAAFYDGPVWRQHRDAANATMVDSDDVLLLRPAWPGAGIVMQGRRRAGAEVRTALPGRIEITVFPLDGPAGAELADVCKDVMTPAARDAGADVLGWYVTEPTPNDFPRLPVREGVSVLVRILAFADAAARNAFVEAEASLPQGWAQLARRLVGAPQRHGLIPTARSAIHA